MKPRRVTIYKTRYHLAATIALVALPFVMIFFGARISHIQARTLFADLGVSLYRLCLAYLIAVALAWLSAVLLYKGSRAAVALPLFDVLQSFPTFAALPLATYFWGQNNFTIIFFLVITIIWPVFFSIISQLKLIEQGWEEAVEISGLRGVQYVRLFLWPISLPGVVTGSIIGLGEGWEALIATEIIVGTHVGLGSFFNTYDHNTAVTAAGIFGFLLIIFIVNKLLWLPLLEKSHKMLEV